ncbi:MAG: UDP-glucose 4-epimerase GalE [Patescibacteria group bacterium]|nr:UDP-glucose 4-epimerase GalE [Patescibacteria group bacterium]
MKILVTGGAGYIGSHMVRLLLKNGHQVAVLDNLENGHRESLPAEITFFKTDLRNLTETEKTLASFQPEAVIHFACYIVAGESMEKPFLYFENNLLGGINLLEAMRKKNIDKIIFSSSAAVYGKGKNKPLKETDPIAPSNTYGETKAMLEKIISWYAKIYKIRYVAFRYFNAAGANYGIGEQHEPETHLIPLLLQVANNRRKNAFIFGDDYPTKDGTCIRDYIHVTDLCQAHLKALEYLTDPNNSSEIFNLGTTEGKSVLEITELIEKTIGKKLRIKIAKRRPGDPPSLTADITKALKKLDWQPEKSLEEIITSAWQWEQKLASNKS